MSLMFPAATSAEKSPTDLLRDLVTAFYKMSSSDRPAATCALAGRLYKSRSGWILLAVPNALIRGAFAALDEPGLELPPGLNAHISVIRPEELETLASGADSVTERGHMFRYNLGPIKTVAPAGWSEMSRVWFVEVHSPELQQLRRSYGLTPLPNDNKFKFHITLAVRRKGVLQNNTQSKESQEKQVKQAKESQISNSLLQKSVQQQLGQPFDWNPQKGVAGNVYGYLGDINRNFQNNVRLEQGSRRIAGLYDPQQRWRDLLHMLETGDVSPELTNPLDKLVYRWAPR